MLVLLWAWTALAAVDSERGGVDWLSVGVLALLGTGVYVAWQRDRSPRAGGTEDEGTP